MAECPCTPRPAIFRTRELRSRAQTGNRKDSVADRPPGNEVQRKIGKTEETKLRRVAEALLQGWRRIAANKAATGDNSVETRIRKARGGV